MGIKFEEASSIKYHSYGVTFLAFSPDEVLLVSTGSDGKIKVLEVDSGNEVTVIDAYEPSSPIHAASLISNGESFATSSLGAPVKIWDIFNARPKWTITQYRDVCSLAFSPHGLLACGTTSGPIRLWDITGTHERKTLIGHEAAINALSFSPDGRFLASVSDDCTARTWEIRKGIHTWTFNDMSSLQSIAFSPDGQSVAIAINTLPGPNSRNGHVRVCRIFGHTMVAHIAKLFSKTSSFTLRENVLYVKSIAFAPNGEFVAFTMDDIIELWDLRNAELLDTLNLRSDVPERVCFSPSGAWLACGTSKGLVLLWKLRYE
jgi:WD40 repeat protein